MKKTYFTSLGFVLLGMLLSTIMFSFSSEKPKLTSLTKEKKLSANLVHIDTVQQEIAAHQMWSRFVPSHITFDPINKRILYPESKRISEEDFLVLKSYYDKFKEGNKISIFKIPFHTKLSYSYFISKADIDSAFAYDPSANGINVYIAMKGIVGATLDSLKSHLYVVPTQKNNSKMTLHDSLLESQGVIYALDLTDPCPNLCDSLSILFQPELKPYEPK